MDRKTHHPAAAMRVIVVDDDPIFRTVALTKLQRMSHVVTEAGDGSSAWDAIVRGGADLALVDLEMPNMKGVELIRCIRSHPRTRHMPVVVITSRNDAEAVRGSLEAGATSFMTKPVNWSMFANHIDFLLRLHSAAETGRRSQGLLDRAQRSLVEVAVRLQDDCAGHVDRILEEAHAAMHQRGPGSEASVATSLASIVHEANAIGTLLEQLLTAVAHETNDGVVGDHAQAS
jgi:CheY-like chemotaxis protein